MDKLTPSSDEYRKKLAERRKKSRVSRSYQQTGLDVAKLLDDWDHRGLHIKLAKELGETKLRMFAKAIDEQKNIKGRKGAYLMSILFPKEKKDKDSDK